MDLKVGEVGVAYGVRYCVLRDERERRPVFGMTTVRITQDQYGQTHRFIRGIEVEREDKSNNPHFPRTTCISR